MTRHPVFILVAITAFSFTVLDCARQVQKSEPEYVAPSYPQSASPIFDGVQYRMGQVFWAKSIGPSYLIKRPNANFMVLGLTLTNVTKSPLKSNNRPIFHLEDQSGATYQPSNVILLESISMKLISEPFNPNVPVHGYLVFDVPKERQYRLRIVSPFYAKTVIATRKILVDPFFYFKLTAFSDDDHFDPSH